MKPLLIAQISDTHIREPGELCSGRVDTAAALRACVEQLQALTPRPDALLVTGDLVDQGREGEYRHLRELLRPLPLPTLVIPGNHDDRAALREAFPERASAAEGTVFFQYAFEAFPLRIIALDTLVPGHEGGELCNERLVWLDKTLAAAPEKPTLLMMHHPPFRTGIVAMDRYGLAGAAGLREVVARHPQVERIVCGHLHRAIEARLGRVPVSVCPSPAHQISLDLLPGMRARYVMEPPGFLLHAWQDDASLVTHLVPIGTFDGPHLFRDQSGAEGAM